MEGKKTADEVGLAHMIQKCSVTACPWGLGGCSLDGNDVWVDSRALFS